MSQEQSKTLELDKYRLAVGLYWQPFYNKKDVKTLAKEVKAQFLIQINSQATHRPGIVGFPTREVTGDLKRKTHYAFASMFLDYVSKFEHQGQSINLDDLDVVGVFEFADQLFQLIIISEGLIIKDVIGDFELIHHEYEAALSFLQKKTVKFVSAQAPSDWSSDAFNIEPKTIIDGVQLKRHRLNSLNVSAKQLLLIGLILAIAYAGYSYYESYQQAERERLIAIAKAKKAKQEAQLKDSADMPWHKSPRAVSVWRACSQTLEKVELYPAGWHYSALGCNDNGITVTWERSSGLVSSLLAEHPNALVEIDGNKAIDNLVHDLPLEPRTTPAKANQLFDKRSTIIQLNEISQRYGLTLKISSDKTSKALPGQNNTSNTVVEKVNFEIETSLLPVGELLSKIPQPGLVVDHFASTENGKWLIKGVLYVAQ